ncbi:hypothetical protein Lepto7376_3293 [[Leptolyngbya] sp. PCC 7376]|uniref:H-type lectin domain-containing protein n=1 Tax=[Leptolyngbya] sp. PCC 7376 TaxID=111781 RepID=UPI00029F151A|nr:H-type lectin domain-containing protein [[Leptolyngbya] sp. PCC 7376]AFY39519.1 hypothetical protein Lepto7376_3293 [[Leptolyngbya] sp. PCC 7376]
MSNNSYQDSYDVQEYLDLNREIEQTAEDSGSDMSNSIYFNSANFALTWMLTANVVPSAIRLSTMQSYVAYYAVMFVGEFISEMLERNGQGEAASYFGNDYDMEMDWGDAWYDDLGESVIQAAYDTLMGIQSTVDLVIKGFDLGSLEETLKNSINGELPRLTHDEKKEEAKIWNADEYIFREGGGNDYLDMDKRKHDASSFLQKFTVYGGGGHDYIANVDKAYGEDGNDQIKDANNAWGGKGDDYITNISNTAKGESGDDYIKNADVAYDGDDDDYIINSAREAHGDEGVETITFGESFDATPIVIAKLGSLNGIDTATLRLGSSSISSTGFDAFVQEDLSLDTELDHANEAVSYLAFNGGGGSLRGFAI